jgi:hypothetical protein
VVSALAACGGSSSLPVTTTLAAADTTVAASPATAAKAAAAFVAVAPPATPISFSNGFAGVDANNAPVAISGATTVAFTGGTASSPAFAMTNGGKTAQGTTTFGSCTFTFNADSPFAADHPWGPNKSFKVDPCTLSIPTAGTVANSVATTKTITLTFGAVSGTVTKSVTVAPDGSVSVGGTPIATVITSVVTGATGVGS